MEQKSLFIEFMGDSPTIKILDYLLTERDLDFSITDIAKNSGIGRTTLYRIWADLIKNKIITSTRTIGKAKLYKLNKDNFVIKKLIEIDDALIIKELKKHSKKIEITAS
ncbi:MAG: helix-turn-helix domain-containing protein [Candidatus Woesearchaeota archaeon]